MAAVARAQAHAEMLGAQPVDELSHPFVGAWWRRLRRDLQSAAVRDPVGGDRDVQHDVADAEFVDEVAEFAEPRDEVGFERAECSGTERVFAERAPHGGEVEPDVVGLLVDEVRQETPLGHLGAAEPRARRAPLEHEIPASFSAQERANAPEVALEGRRADVEAFCLVEHVDAVRVRDERAHEAVHALARRVGVDLGAQRRRGIRAGPVAERT